MNIEAIVAHYVTLRDTVAEIEADAKAKAAPLKADMQTIEAALLKHMQSGGVQNLKTAAGTAYISEKTSATVEDWDALLEYVLETEAFELLERRVSKTAYAERLASGTPPPGVKYTSMLGVNCRRS